MTDRKRRPSLAGTLLDEQPPSDGCLTRRSRPSVGGSARRNTKHGGVRRCRTGTPPVEVAVALPESVADGPAVAGRDGLALAQRRLGQMLILLFTEILYARQV